MKPLRQFSKSTHSRRVAAWALTVAFCQTLPATAGVLAYEGFAYPEGGEIEGGAGGSGWAAAWIEQANAGGSEVIAAGNLVTGYPNFDAASQGKSATLNAGHRVARLLDVSPAGPFGTLGYLDGNGNIGADGTTLYLSVVLAETSGNANGYFEFVFNRDNLGDPGRIGGIGDDLGTADFNLRAGGTHTRLITRDTNVHRFVVRFDFLPGNDRITVYADPTQIVEPGAGDVQMTQADMSFDGFSFATFGGDNILNVDEIRVTTSYAEAAIAGAPEWTAASGAFGTAANWSSGQVPDGLSASILNGGTAKIVDGDGFTVDSLFLGGYAGSGTLKVEGGSLYPTTLRVGGTNALGGSGTGTVTMTAGEIVGGGVEEIWFGSRGGEGTLNMSGTSSLTNNQQIHFGRDGGTGHGTIAGSAYFSATQVGIGLASPGKTSEVTVEGDAFFSVNGGNLVAGWSGDATGKGILNIHDSATVTVNGEFRVGFAGASGRLAADGGTLQVSGPDGYLVSGRTGGTGEIEISGNAVVEVTRFMMAGADGTGNGTITVDGGASVIAERFTVAYEQDTSGVITVNGGTLLATSTGGTGVVLGGGGNGVMRQLNLNGGMITASGFAKKDGDLALDINFNGGTVRASEDNPDFFRSGDFDGSSAGIVAGDLELAAGGLNFDTAGFNVGITQALSSNGGLKKSGTGTLIIAAAGTYSGGTSVTDGTLELANPSLNDNSTVSISGASSILSLSHGASDTIANLVIDGVEKGPGLYRSAQGSGPGTVLPQLSGTGVLNVSGQSLNYATWLAANAPATGFGTDSDRDGIPNGVEHVLGTSPNQSTPGLAVSAGINGSAVLTHSLNPQLAADVSYDYEWSSDLVQWRKSGGTNTSGMSATITASPPVQGVVTVTATPGGTVVGKLFVRLAAGLAD